MQVRLLPRSLQCRAYACDVRTHHMCAHERCACKQGKRPRRTASVARLRHLALPELRAPMQHEGLVAQWIRHRPTEPGIAGSSPAGVMQCLRSPGCHKGLALPRSSRCQHQSISTTIRLSLQHSAARPLRPDGCCIGRGAGGGRLDSRWCSGSFSAGGGAAVELALRGA